MDKLHQERVWASLDEFHQTPEYLESARQEFVELPVVDTLSDNKLAEKPSSRRDFLKFMGFSLGAATLAACETPVRKAIPYVVKPEEVVPGVANYYASTLVDGGDYCAVLVKTRESRPIKIEGNTLSSVTRGGTSARAQASVISLYDTYRLRRPARVKDGLVTDEGAISWKDLDTEVIGKLSSASKIVLVTGTIISPSAKAAIATFKAKYPSSSVVSYDAISYAAMLEANNALYGSRTLPSYHFDKADVVVSFGADFLGTWLSPVEFTAQYTSRRVLKEAKKGNKLVLTKEGIAERKKFWHVQYESGMSLTGSNADNRVLVKPSEYGTAIALLYNEIAQSLGAPTVATPATSLTHRKALAGVKKTAQKLLAAKGASLVVCGVNDVAMQTLVNGINLMLGNYDNTIIPSRPCYMRQGSDDLKQQLAGADAILLWDVNPVYDSPDAAAVKDAIQKASLSVLMSNSLNETGTVCQFVAPTHHVLEAWGDAEPQAGRYSLIQPTIKNLFDTRQAELSLLVWSGAPEATQGEQPYYDFVKSYWKQNIFPKQTEFNDFAAFWDNTLQQGVLELPVPAASIQGVSPDLFAQAAASLPKPAGEGIEVNFFETVAMGDGRYANNPWLQELPDPVTRGTWSNYVSVPLKWDGNKRYATFNNLKDGDLVDITIGDKTFRLPVILQFGQMEGTISIALGYGRTVSGPVGNKIGTDLYPALGRNKDGFVQYHATGVQVSEKKGVDENFACVQMHHTMGITAERDGKVVTAADGKPLNVDEQILGNKGFQGSLTERTVLFHTHVDQLEQKIADVRKKREEFAYLNEKTLYPGHEEKYKTGVHWGMSIDMNACTGCGACVVACQAENNIPVVGKFEVHRVHEMAWLRIDRYYYGDEETPNTAYQPMMCQHCDNAPCENVCPVAATNHSIEGLNQMTYNRCIGTRYCANNCPYKVRRFNWLDYTTADMFFWNEVNLNRFLDKNPEDKEYYYLTDNLTRMVLNPDVTVRSRGVIEKCSFCVQRIQEAKLTAKVENRQLRDGDVKTACQTSCPAGCITFGNVNDETTEVSQHLTSDLNYYVIEEINVKPGVGYKMKITNTENFA